MQQEIAEIEDPHEVSYFGNKSWVEVTGVLKQVGDAGELISKYLEGNSWATTSDYFLKTVTTTSSSYVSGFSELNDSALLTRLEPRPEVLECKLSKVLQADAEEIHGLLPELQHNWVAKGTDLFVYRPWNHNNTVAHESFPAPITCVSAFAPPYQFEEADAMFAVGTHGKVFMLSGKVVEHPTGTQPTISLATWPGYNLDIGKTAFLCSASTHSGRAFFGADDGCLYEVVLKQKIGFFGTTRGSQKFRYACAHSMFKSDPLRAILVDEERNILYTLSESSVICVFHLGVDGKEPPCKVAAAHLKQLLPKEKPASLPSIVVMSNPAEAESHHVHLVLTLSDGRRVQISTEERGKVGAGMGRQGLGFLSRAMRGRRGRKAPPGGSMPTGLRVINVRPPPNVPDEKGEPVEVSKVAAALSSTGLLVAAEPCQANSSLSRVVISYRDGSLLQDASWRGRGKERGEFVSVVAVHGEVLEIKEGLPAGNMVVHAETLLGEVKHKGKGSLSSRVQRLWGLGALQTQGYLPCRTLLVLTDKGTAEIALMKPMDLLVGLLRNEPSMDDMEAFVRRFGEEETMAMCYQIAGGLVHPPFPESPFSESWNEVKKMATLAIEDPKIGGTGRLEEGKKENGSLFGAREIVMIPSGKEGGLRAICSRILQEIWKKKIVALQEGAEAEGKPKVVTLSLCEGILRDVESKSRSFELYLRGRRTNEHRAIDVLMQGMERFLRPRTDDSEGNDFLVKETRRVESIRRLLRRTAEGAALLSCLGSHGLTLAAQNLGEDEMKALCEMTFEQLVGSPQGDRLVSSLLFNFFVNRDNTQTQVQQTLSRISEKCGSFCRSSDVTLYEGLELLVKAESYMEGSANRDRALALLKMSHLAFRKVPENPAILKTCAKLVEEQHYMSAVDLALLHASSQDPNNVALDERMHPNARKTAEDSRQPCYDVIFSIISSLKEQLGTDPEEMGTRQDTLQAVIKVANDSSDRLFLQKLYRYLLSSGLEDMLVKCSNPYFETLMKEDCDPLRNFDRNGHLCVHQGLLRPELAQPFLRFARYLENNKGYEMAACIYLRLGMRKVAGPGELDLDNRLVFVDKALQNHDKCLGRNGGAQFGKMTRASLALLKFQKRARDELMQRIKSLPQDVEFKVLEKLTNEADQLWLHFMTSTDLFHGFVRPNNLTEIGQEMEALFGRIPYLPDPAFIRE